MSVLLAAVRCEPRKSDVPPEAGQHFFAVVRRIPKGVQPTLAHDFAAGKV